MITKFVVNNKTYLITKISLFIAKYSRELRVGIDIRRKIKINNKVCKKKKIKKVQKKTLKEMKKQINKGREKAKKQKKKR